MDPTESPASDRAAETAARAGAFERLKRLLVGDERDALAAADARLARIEREQRDLARRLPDALERAQETADGPDRIARALQRPVTAALDGAVRANREAIVDVLFPVIGPAIRKAIAEALRTLVADLNGAIESSLTLRGLGWRVEAWRSGVPYAEVVLRHSLSFRIDHVFLIERDSGLVLARESAPGLAALDGDAIAGMLTAIGAFVRDSVGGDGDTLDAARVGEHVLWVLEGPRANLACFVRGVPPAHLRDILAERLEALHTRWSPADEAVAIDADEREALLPARLEDAARAAMPTARRAPSRWPLALLAGALILLSAWFAMRHVRHQAALDALRSRLEAHPGFVLTGIDASKRGVVVHGLLDGDAAPLALDADGDGPLGTIALDARGYVSSDDAVVERRARRLLAPPAGATVAVRDGTLSIGGRAAAGWIAAARTQAPLVAGVRAVDVKTTPIDDAAAAAREIAAIAKSLSSLAVVFDRDAEPVENGDAVVDRIADAIRRARALAATAGATPRFIAYGTNDDPGSDAINAHMRELRARWLVAALARRGIDGVELAADDDAAALARHERGARVRLEVGDAR